MFRKYEKTYRIPVPQLDIKGKHFLSKKECKLLLGGKVCITEKVDGANVGIVRHKEGFHLQKRGSLVGPSEHEQFNFFKAWSNNNYEKLLQLPKNIVLYGELMYAKHTVFYNKLPDYFLAFACADKKSGEYWKWKDLVQLCNNVGLYTVPVLYEGHIGRDELYELIPKQSTYGEETAEGLVVWNYKQNIRGKVVRKEFMKNIGDDGHWMHKKLTINKLGE